jgi:putative phosphoesterase
MGIQRVGVISDTHLTQPTEELADLLRGPFRDAAVILHAGDITEMAVLDAFAEKEVIAVCGNMDSPIVRGRLPAKRIWKAGKFRIGLIHGWGEKQGVEERIRGEFEGIDCIVYGHTHAPASRRQDGVYYFNPGSFVGRLGVGGKSVGVLELGKTISGVIYNF